MNSNVAAFRCSGLWPRSASHWPQQNCPWPSPQIIQEVKNDGFDLLSKECPNAQVSFRFDDSYSAMVTHSGHERVPQEGAII
jgi:hypothetical protein